MSGGLCKDMMDKVLTISVAAYHVEEYLAECLDSFTDPRISSELEVLVINDGAGEGIHAIAAQYEKEYPGVFRLIDKENGGHGSTINRGIREASGLYFKTVDGDDLVHPEGLYTLLQYLRTAKEDLVVTEFERFEDGSGRLLCKMKTEFNGRKEGVPYTFDEISQYVYVNMHAAAYRTELLKNMGRELDEHCFYVDAEYMLYPIPLVKTVAFLAVPVYRYRLGRAEQSMSIRSMQKNCQHHEKVLDHLLEFYHEEQERLTSQKSAYIARGIAKIAVSQIKIYLSFPADARWKNKICDMERLLKTTDPDIYHNMSNKAVRLLRHFRYAIYPAASFICRKVYGG